MRRARVAQGGSCPLAGWSAPPGAYTDRVWFFRFLFLSLVAFAAGVGSAAAQPGKGAAPRAAAPHEAPFKVSLPADWVASAGVYAVVHGERADAVTVRRLAAHAAVAIPALSGRLGVPAGAQMDIFVAPDDESFGALQPGHTPDWADGTAWPADGDIFLHAPSARSGTAPRLEQVLDHEIVHILVGRAFQGRPVPRWLQEGLAQYYSGELGPETAETLTRAAGTGQLLPLRLISAGFPDDALGAQLAYAQTADFTAFLAQRAGGGQEGDVALRKLLAAAQMGATLQDAVYACTGDELPLLEMQWQGRWLSLPVRLDGLMRSGLPGLVAAALVAYGALRRRLLYHDGLGRLEAQEREAQERQDQKLEAQQREAQQREAQQLEERRPDGSDCEAEQRRVYN